MAEKVDTLFSLVANNRLEPLIGQTIVVTSRKNCLTNQDRTSLVRDDFYLCARCGVYHSTYVIKTVAFICIFLNPFQSVSDFLILLWLTPDDFTRQKQTSRTGKGSNFRLKVGKKKFFSMLNKRSRNPCAPPLDAQLWDSKRGRGENWDGYVMETGKSKGWDLSRVYIPYLLNHIHQQWQSSDRPM